MSPDTRREKIRALLDDALAAVNPESLMRSALSGPVEAPVTLIAIGKAAAAMCRGAAATLGKVQGICVTNTADVVPDGVELVLGDHPIPGERSFDAGRRVLGAVEDASGRVIALISGGGSALCEHPIPGISRELVRHVNEVLIASGAAIEEINLVRRHLSAIKGGGLARTAGRAIETYALSDVCGADPSVIASGPTTPTAPDPRRAINTMLGHGIELSDPEREAIRQIPLPALPDSKIRVIADGHTAAAAVAKNAQKSGLAAQVMDKWLQGPVDDALDGFLAGSTTGLTIASGEPDVAVSGSGRGGRNTHAALLAAQRLAGTASVFAAFATDGADGNSTTAGAIVDSTTIERGGDPMPALKSSNSATYLEATGDVIVTGPTGTNVADLWVLWR